MASYKNHEYARPFEGRRFPQSSSRRKIGHRNCSPLGSQDGFVQETSKNGCSGADADCSTRVSSQFITFFSRLICNTRDSYLLQLVITKGPIHQVIRQAVDELLTYVALSLTAPCVGPRHTYIGLVHPSS